MYQPNPAISHAPPRTLSFSREGGEGQGRECECDSELWSLRLPFGHRRSGLQEQ